MKIRHLLLLVAVCIAIALVEDCIRQNARRKFAETKPAVSIEMSSSETTKSN
ncbi:hypothetical protein HOD08_03955 [bacterium]|nr:hypothetical protein [bacterium]MBT7102416.1 hypothetical protein [archaeon]